MKKILLTLLLASAATAPAAAGPREDRQAAREQARQDRQESRSERRQSADRPSIDRPSIDRPSVEQRREAVQDRRQVRDQRVESLRERAPQTSPRARIEQRLVDRDAARQVRVDQRQQVQRNIESNAVDRAQRRQQIIDSREALRDRMRSRATPVVSTTPRPGTQPPPPATSRPSSMPQWSTNWRHDGRYDWSNHRRRHRSLFHLGFYYDPFGWGYSPYSIGWRMWPSYYSSGFWLNDPWQYRLPYAPPGTRWIRYYNDAILIDLWSGQVVDVIYGFFW